ncbi:MAG: DNA mismatch repair endonuclease MutL [Muribaculaceae bacterium]|nr:DNA mismatch repair endonuclease MutL [Muribaculaceae bacterium]
MSDVIRLLPDSVANQIAAGEVIQRPASVIKELVENAVDAGATDIRIVVKDAGKTMIQVIDNGCGMTETDARMAFERHATSKIRSADDLFALTTMGFRGEALPSICAISEVEVKTRTEDSPMGTRLLIEGSRVMTQEPVMCERGTVFTVKRLFFNVPARRKFLKSDNVELSNIMREFERLALINNKIRLHIDTGTREIDLRAGTLKQRIADIWKNSINMQLLPVNVDTSLVKIEGFVSRPEFARRRNPLQFFFVNGRHMRHPYFHKGVLSCFENLIASDTQPCYFIKFTVDPQTIDVNIHPTKNEIKFEYEQQIWPILTATIKAALGKFSAVPSIDFDTDALPIRPLKEGEIPSAPEIEVSRDYNPFKTDSYRPERVEKNWESLYDSFKRETHKENSGFFGGRVGTEFPKSSPEPSFASTFRDGINSDAGDEKTFSSLSDQAGASVLQFEEDLKREVAPLCMQYAEKYIISPSQEGLLVIDQHRAHVKVLYEEYLRMVKAMKVVSQGVMFPETITLDENQRSALGEIEEELKRMGFALEYESGESWSITAVPSMLKNVNPGDIILRILDSVTEESANYGKEKVGEDSILERIALIMARSSAIRRGRKLTSLEMEHLMGELFALPDPGLTPSGNRIFCLLDEQKIDRMFGI